MAEAKVYAVVKNGGELGFYKSLPAAKKLAERIARNAPLAVRACKAAMSEGVDLPMDEAIDAEVRAFSGCFDTQDQKRGMQAFLNKQKNIEFQNN